jgi:hypothetical protein
MTARVVCVDCLSTTFHAHVFESEGPVFGDRAHGGWLDTSAKVIL